MSRKGNSVSTLSRAKLHGPGPRKLPVLMPQVSLTPPIRVRDRHMTAWKRISFIVRWPSRCCKALQPRLNLNDQTSRDKQTPLQVQCARGVRLPFRQLRPVRSQTLPLLNRVMQSMASFSRATTHETCLLYHCLVSITMTGLDVVYEWLMAKYRENRSRVS